MSEEDIWIIKLDWLNITRLLGLDSVSEISELKKDKAIKKISKSYGLDYLMDLDPSELDKIVSDELKELMKKELAIKARQDVKKGKDFQNKFIPFKNGGIININPRDLKDLDIDFDSDPTEILKKLAKKFFRADDDDDDKDRSNEDNTGYYI